MSHHCFLVPEEAGNAERETNHNNEKENGTNQLDVSVIIGELTLIRSMGVLTASGSGSVWLTVTISCLLRPLRLDFF